MEASGSPERSPETATTQPPPPAPPSAEDRKAGGGWRILAVILALALAFASAVMIYAMIDIGDTPLRDDCVPPQCTEYFDGSSTQKTISLALGWPSGVLAGIAALLALVFAMTGRRGRLVLQLTGLAVVLGALSILVGSL